MKGKTKKKMAIAPSGLHSSMVLSVRFKRDRCATSRKKLQSYHWFKDGAY